MTFRRLLIANRGEIAVRIARAAAEDGLTSVAVYAEDDANSLHWRVTDEARPIGAKGAAAYLDAERIVAIAREADCEAVHPGYGFLSENADFARLCADAGIIFVGPSPDVLARFGDKASARALAAECDVPVLPGTQGPTSLEEARTFFASLGDGGAMMIKAIAGGGGRGMRPVTKADELETAYEICRAEAKQAFGNDAVYVERRILRARHIEVQIAGDSTGNVVHFGERECSLQRRHQKLVEVAPSPDLSPDLRDRLTGAALRMAGAVKYNNIGTFEFLVDAGSPDGQSDFAFIEANARLQVEHTVTEQVMGVDLVKLQFDLANGFSLANLEIESERKPHGFAVQVRINSETMNADGSTKPSGGALSAFHPPSGPGVRVDSGAYAGYRTNPAYDSLLAKVIGFSPAPSFADAAAKTYRALSEFKIEGVATNIPFLQSLLSHPEIQAGRAYTDFVADHIADLVAPAALDHPKHYFRGEDARGAPAVKGAGAKVDAVDPLAVLDHGKTAGNGSAPVAADPALGAVPAEAVGPDGTVPILAPMQGTIVSVDLKEGDLVHGERQVFIMEAMKMQHVIPAGLSGAVREIAVAEGDAVYEGHPLAFIEERAVDAPEDERDADIDLDHIRPDLAETQARHEIGYDDARPDAVARRRKTGQRTARENIEDLVDPGTFVEYGPLMIAAQRARRTIEDLIERTPADGLVAGIGQVNGDRFDETAARCAVMSYDYTVLAGTQGFKNHEKKDRLFELAERSRLPMVFFTEGGGGRPGDTDWVTPAGLQVLAFNLFAKLSGLVPLVGIASGRCFAGNAALLGCCDVVIATENATLGMGGPAMIEGGGLGVFRPEEVGPMSVQVPNGVVDIPVADEAEAVQAAKKYLSYFQGATDDWECADQRLLRRVIPEDRLRIYDVRSVIETMADTGSVLELRKHFGLGMVTALIRIEGRPLGVIANNPTHLAGAVDSDGADKAARFMQLCDAFDIPILTLCDTPGMMVGPEVEKTALVRHCCRLFVTGANLTVPLMTIVLRKAYGLGAQAMAGGSFRAPFFTVAWPTGEFGGMGLEGAVKLGFRKELAAVEDAEERKALFEKMVAQAYDHGKALNTASHFEFDDVIDPMASRQWIVAALKSAPPPPPRTGKKRPAIDTW